MPKAESKGESLYSAFLHIFAVLKIKEISGGRLSIKSCTQNCVQALLLKLQSVKK